MRDIDYQQLQITSTLLVIGASIIGLIITYFVIYFAVRHALRSHARWEYDGGAAGEDGYPVRRATPEAR